MAGTFTLFSRFASTRGRVAPTTSVRSEGPAPSLPSASAPTTTCHTCDRPTWWINPVTPYAPDDYQAWCVRMWNVDELHHDRDNCPPPTEGPGSDPPPT